MRENQKLTVVIPIYNVEPYLRQCLDSVVNQTYKNLEIILVDDGSPDNCGAICDEYAANDDRIIVIHKENGGLSAARNDGIRKATGEWITFVDSDDWCELDYYEQMLKEEFDSDTDIICASDHYVESASDSTTQRRCFKEGFAFCSEKERHILMNRVLDLKGTVLVGDAPFGYPWDKLYRGNFLLREDLLFDESLRVCEDALFNYRAMSKAGKVVGRICAGYHYRFNLSSITKTVDPKRPEKNYQYVSKLCKYAEGYGLDDGMRDVLNAHVMNTFLSVLSLSYFHPDNTMPYTEILHKVKKMKDMPCYYNAIHSKNSCYLSGKRTMLKYILRYDFLNLFVLLYFLKRKVSSKNGSSKVAV